MTTLIIPTSDGPRTPVPLGAPAAIDVSLTPPRSRVAYAAAHVVANPLRASADGTTQGADQVDWDATLELRHEIWATGLGVAEAMDTAQRGMGLDWQTARELACRTLKEARSVGGAVVVGVGTDHLGTGPASSDDVVRAYLDQLGSVESEGGRAVMMASRNLAAIATSPDDYLAVYDAVLSQARRPVVLHWLGRMFDPALAGYWGHENPKDAASVVLDLIESHADRIDGIKVSLLDAEFERALRRRLPKGVRLFTGDDYNYVDLIAGDADSHSDALLGAFATIAPYASAALARLDSGDVGGFRDVLGPTETLSRLVFTAPTQYYKVGVAWLAYLRGAQPHFRMIGGLESGRSLTHLGDLLRAAAGIGYFPDPAFTADRAARYFSAHGLG